MNNINNQNSIRENILYYYDMYINLITNDPEISSIMQNIKNLEKESEMFYNLKNLKNYNITYKSLNETKEIFYSIMKVKLDVLYKTYPDIFEKIVMESIPRDILDNVLYTFEKFQKGSINEKDAISSGMKYTQKRFNLPKDFFNEDGIDTFIQNKHILPEVDPPNMNTNNTNKNANNMNNNPKKNKKK